MFSFLRTVLGFLVAWVVGTASMSAIHTQFVIRQVEALGVSVSFDERLSWTLADVVGMNDFSAPSEVLPVAVFAALLVGFLVAALLTRLFRGLRMVVFMTAGFCAIAALLYTFQTVFGLMPIAGARGMGPLLVHGAAGVLAALFFSILTPGPRRKAAS